MPRYIGPWQDALISDLYLMGSYRRAHVWDAETDPTVDDDLSEGWHWGSFWLNVLTDTLYQCVDPENGAAVWRQVAGGASDIPHRELAVSGAHTIDRADGQTHDLTLVGSTTFTLAGAITGQTTTIWLWLRPDGNAVTWDPLISWDGGTEPDLSDPLVLILLATVDDGASWVGVSNTGGGSSVGALDDLTDVTLTSPATGDLLRYDGAGWVNTTAAAVVEAAGRWEPVVHDPGTGPELVWDDGDIVVTFVT